MKWVDLIGKDEDHDRKHEGRGEYDRDRDREHEWWREPPSWWRGTHPQWQQLPAWQQQQWWQYQSYYQQPTQQTYYQQPYYQQAYYTPEQLRERAVHYEQAGYRWVPGYGGTAGHWERPRAPHITIRRTPAYGQRWW
jgi:hypothetical protein